MSVITVSEAPVSVDMSTETTVLRSVALPSPR
jgi:hypothetical protein